MPINLMFPSMLNYAVHSSDKRHVRNTNYLKTLLQSMINDRVSGKSHGYTEGTEDLLSILISNEFYRGRNDMIVEELITFFAAGMITIHLATANLIMHMITNPKLLVRLLEETMPTV